MSAFSSSSICTKAILPNKPTQPILTAAMQLMPFSAFSPVACWSINTIDWMVNLLTRLNKLQIKRGRRRWFQQSASKPTWINLEKVGEWKGGGGGGGVSGLEMHPSPASISLILLLLSFTTARVSVQLSVTPSLSLSLGWTGCTRDRKCTTKPHFLTDQVMQSGSRGWRGRAGDL